MNSHSFQLAGEIVPRIATDEKVVALIFDDGPAPGHTASVLRTLEEEEIRATFYVVGEEVERHPEEAARIVAAGHELGNRSYSRQRMVFVSGEFVRDEIETAG